MHDPRATRLRRFSLDRVLALSSGLYAVGTGVFLAGNAVYFTQVVGLRPSQVGIGLSVAGVVAVLCSVPAGRFADRWGMRRTWAAAAFLEALVYLAYPFAQGMVSFLGVVVALALMECTGRAARGAYTLAVIPTDERVRTLAHIRSALNVGFAAGALLSALALAAKDVQVVRAVPWLTCVLLLVNVLLIRALPATARHAPPRGARPLGGAALRNRPFFLLSLLNGQVGVNQVLLTVVFPLWLVDGTNAPHAAVAWLYGTNTVMCILLQVRFARGTESLHGALRATWLAAAAIAAACTLAMTAHWTHAWVTVGVLWLAYVALTVGELLSSASSWTMVAELSDPARRAEYQGVWRIGVQLQMVVGPGLLTWLAVSWHPEGLLVIGAWTLLSVVAMPRLVRAARQRLDAAAAPEKPPGRHRSTADTIEPSLNQPAEELPCPTSPSSSPAQTPARARPRQP
ncbi:MAG: MFS transporter [Marmoricola sp.]